MSSKRKPKLVTIATAVFPKENTEEEKEYLAACLLNLLQPGKRPMPPRPPELAEGREVVEVTEELYSDGTRKLISRRDATYSKPAVGSVGARGRRDK